MISTLTVFLALLVFAASCGQPPPEQGGQQAGGTTGETTAGTTASEPFNPEQGDLVIYSGREEGLVGPLIEQFEEESGIDVQIRYGETAELGATLLEEGENSPADVFFAQDPGALGAVSDEGFLQDLPQGTLQKVPERFRDPEGQWVGTSGRARVVAYNTETLNQSELPDSILDFTDPKWQGRIGWVPTNASFQVFVTALRETRGEDVAREWLEGIQANDPLEYPDNLPAVEGVASGEVQVAFVNHYYLYQAIEEQGSDIPVRNYYLKNGDPGALVSVAGAGILQSAEHDEEARQFVEFLLSAEAQQYFADETYEYPLVAGVEAQEGLPPLQQIESPNVDLGNLDDLEGTLELMQETGAL